MNITTIQKPNDSRIFTRTKFSRWTKGILRSFLKFQLVALIIFFALCLIVGNSIGKNEDDVKNEDEQVEVGYNEVFPNLNQRLKHKIDLKHKPELVFFLILCQEDSVKGPGGKIATDVQRQFRQAAVMLKSAAALTSTTLRFIVIADSEELFQQLVSTTSNWPEEYRAKILFEHHSVWYPPDRNAMKKMFRVCATERLFIPEMFPNEESGIYIDTDLIFLRPPEDLWKEFEYFDDKQLAAMSPCLYHYGTKKNQVPYYGESGLNAGIMHMNLTRMKSFPLGGWTKANMKVFDRFKRKIKLADQDILNILFYQNPEYLYELGCEWNYRVWQCSQGSNLCKAADNKGVNIIHGNALSFVNNNEMKLQTIFQAWEKYNLGEPLLKLLNHMKYKLQLVSAKNLPSKCAQIKNIDQILLSQFENTVNILEL